MRIRWNGYGDLNNDQMRWILAVLDHQYFKKVFDYQTYTNKSMILQQKKGHSFKKGQDVLNSWFILVVSLYFDDGRNCIHQKITINLAGRSRTNADNHQ